MTPKEVPLACATRAYLHRLPHWTLSSVLDSGAAFAVRTATGEAAYIPPSVSSNAGLTVDHVGCGFRAPFRRDNRGRTDFVIAPPVMLDQRSAVVAREAEMVPQVLARLRALDDLYDAIGAELDAVYALLGEPAPSADGAA